LNIIRSGELLLSGKEWKCLLTFLAFTLFSGSLHPTYASETKAETQSIPFPEDPTPGYWETSEFLIGSVSVGIILLESNGTIDPSTEDWTDNEIRRVLSEIKISLDWWVSQNPDVSFINETHVRVPTNYEPISRNSTDDWLWISEAVGYLGYTDEDYWTRVFDYVNDLRDKFDTDWAFAMFIVDNSNDGDGCFSNGWSEYAASLGGPYLVMTYNIGDWGVDYMDVVCAHETGHVFFATDEYNGITENSGYLNVSDIEGSGDLMETAADWSLSEGTKGQLGWLDSDDDGIPDIVDTLPRIHLDPQEISQSRINYTGVAAVTPIQNKNPYTWNPLGNRNVTINKIEYIEFRVDSGNWTTVTPTDGSFDNAVENFTFVTQELEPGNYTIEVKATNQWGNSGYTNQTIEIPEFLPTDLNQDGIVNIIDLSTVAYAFGTEEGDENYSAMADLDNNGKVNVIDLSTVAMDYGKTI